MLLDKQVHGDAQQNELRHDGFRVRIDAEDIENIVCRDLLNQRRDALNAENQLERTIHQLLDTGAEEGDRHDRHENTRYKEERLERKLDGERIAIKIAAKTTTATATPSQSQPTPSPSCASVMIC